MGQAKVHTMGGFYGAKQFKSFNPVYLKRMPICFKNRTEQDAGINLEWGDRSLQDRRTLESVGRSAEGVCTASKLKSATKRGSGFPIPLFKLSAQQLSRRSVITKISQAQVKSSILHLTFRPCHNHIQYS